MRAQILLTHHNGSGLGERKFKHEIQDKELCVYSLNVRPLFADTPDILYKPSETKTIPFAHSTSTMCVRLHEWVWAWPWVQPYKRLKELFGFELLCEQVKSSQLSICFHVHYHYHPLWFMWSQVCTCVCVVVGLQ